MLNIVLWDANSPLDDPSDESAKVWLQEIVKFVRDVLGDQQPALLIYDMNQEGTETTEN